MQRTRITDIPYELLQSIIIPLAKSSKGAEGLARAITVCKSFEKYGEDEVVLRVTNFDSVELSDVGVGLFQCNNSLIKRCAQLGNVSAQYLLAKVVLATCNKVPRNVFNNYFEANGGGIAHSKLVRLFMKQCNTYEFASMVPRLFIYLKRFSSEAFRDSFFQGMGRMILVLGIFTAAGLQEGRWSYDPETKLLPTEFEREVITRLRNRSVRRNLWMEEIERDCKDMAQLCIVVVAKNGNGDEEEGVVDLGERFFHHLLSKYFDEKVKLLDPNVLLSNSSFKQMKKLCVILAKEYEIHRSEAVKAFDEPFYDRLD